MTVSGGDVNPGISRGRKSENCAGQELNPMQILAIARISVIQLLPCSFARKLAQCAGRELNPGYVLGKRMSYHEGSYPNLSSISGFSDSVLYSM